MKEVEELFVEELFIEDRMLSGYIYMKTGGW